MIHESSGLKACGTKWCFFLLSSTFPDFFRSGSLVLLNGNNIVVDGKFHPLVGAIDHRLIHGQPLAGKKEYSVRRPSIRIVLAPVKLELSRKNDGLNDKVAGRGRYGAL